MINNIVLAGNVVKDPATRSLPSGKNVSTIRLAVNNPISEKEVLFIDVDTWDKQQEFVGKYVKKGSAVSVVGRLVLDEWTDKQGEKQSKYKVNADRVNFFGGKKKDGVASASNDQSDEFDDAAFAAAAGIKM
jgi:single-strand DNA-binding protein